MIHRRIMDEAADRPDASLDVLADVVPGASPELVERVLDEYGDPADETGDTQHEGDEDGGNTVPALEELSEKQRETIHAIQAHPEATQRELGKLLDVTAATISQRVSGIPDFEWSDRAAFADAILETQGSTEPTDQEPSAQASASDTDTTDSGGAQDDSEQGTGGTDVAADTGVEDTEDSESDSGAGVDTVSTAAAAASSGQSSSDTITIALGDASSDADGMQDDIESDEPAAAEAGAGAPAPDGQTATVTTEQATASDGGTVRPQEPVDVDRLTDRISSLETKLESLDASVATGESERRMVLTDPDLVAKVVRACMSDDDIDQSEEREIIAALMD